MNTIGSIEYDDPREAMYEQMSFNMFMCSTMDHFYGGDGSDTLLGGRGDDWLSGGGGVGCRGALAVVIDPVFVVVVDGWS